MPSDAMAQVLSALGEPVRWRMLGLVGGRDRMDGRALQEALSLSKGMVSYHARILVQAGLLDARKRSRSVVYTLRPDVLAELHESLAPLARPRAA